MTDSAEYIRGRKADLLEAALWIEDAMNQLLSASSEAAWLRGCAQFMRQRVEELSDMEKPHGQ